MLTCPICGSQKFQAGPGVHAGDVYLARNYRCENGHEWNVSVFGMESIGPADIVQGVLW
jgi:hypothetical protein